MSTLSPPQAALIARGVYLLQDQTVSQTHANDDLLGSEEMFGVTDSSRSTGPQRGPPREDRCQAGRFVLLT